MLTKGIIFCKTMRNGKMEHPFCSSSTKDQGQLLVKLLTAIPGVASACSLLHLKKPDTNCLGKENRHWNIGIGSVTL